MVNTILNFLQVNKNVDYTGLVIPIVVVYIVLFWLIVSIWVASDARKRFKKLWLPILIGILNFILSVPFMVLYLLIRPEMTDEFDEWVEGGVNIPIVNFVGQDGVAMSFELRINPKKITTENASEMKIDVSFDSPDPQKQLVDSTKVLAPTAEVKAAKAPRDFKIKSSIKSLRQKFSAQLVSIKNKVGTTSKPKSADTDKKYVFVDSEANVKATEAKIADEASQKHKKKKKRRNR